MTALARVVVVGLAITAAGCSRHKAVSPEAFVESVDLNAIAERCAPPGLQWGSHGNDSLRGQKFFIGASNADPGSLGAFADAVQKELVTAVERNGATPRVLPPPVIEGLAPGLQGFR